MTRAFRASRYNHTEEEAGDYINCPFNRDEYEGFVKELLEAQRIPLREFEQDINTGVKAGKGTFFEGCLPIEVLAARADSARWPLAQCARSA